MLGVHLFPKLCVTVLIVAVAGCADRSNTQAFTEKATISFHEFPKSPVPSGSVAPFTGVGASALDWLLGQGIKLAEGLVNDVNKQFGSTTVAASTFIYGVETDKTSDGNPFGWKTGNTIDADENGISTMNGGGFFIVLRKFSVPESHFKGKGTSYAFDNLPALDNPTDLKDRYETKAVRDLSDKIAKELAKSMPEKSLLRRGVAAAIVAKIRADAEKKGANGLAITDVDINAKLSDDEIGTKLKEIVKDALKKDLADDPDDKANHHYLGFCALGTILPVNDILSDYPTTSKNCHSVCTKPVSELPVAGHSMRVSLLGYVYPAAKAANLALPFDIPFVKWHVTNSTLTLQLDGPEAPTNEQFSLVSNFATQAKDVKGAGSKTSAKDGSIVWQEEWNSGDTYDSRWISTNGSSYQSAIAAVPSTNVFVLKATLSESSSVQDALTNASKALDKINPKKVLGN